MVLSTLQNCNQVCTSKNCCEKVTIRYMDERLFKWEQNCSSLLYLRLNKQWWSNCHESKTKNQCVRRLSATCKIVHVRYAAREQAKSTACKIKGIHRLAYCRWENPTVQLGYWRNAIIQHSADVLNVGVHRRMPTVIWGKDYIVTWWLVRQGKPRFSKCSGMVDSDNNLKGDKHISEHYQTLHDWKTKTSSWLAWMWTPCLFLESWPTSATQHMRNGWQTDELCGIISKA